MRRLLLLLVLACLSSRTAVRAQEVDEVPLQQRFSDIKLTYEIGWYSATDGKFGARITLPLAAVHSDFFGNSDHTILFSYASPAVRISHYAGSFSMRRLNHATNAVVPRDRYQAGPFEFNGQVDLADVDEGEDVHALLEPTSIAIRFSADPESGRQVPLSLNKDFAIIGVTASTPKAPYGPFLSNSHDYRDFLTKQLIVISNGATIRFVGFPYGLLFFVLFFTIATVAYILGTVRRMSVRRKHIPTTVPVRVAVSARKV